MSQTKEMEVEPPMHLPRPSSGRSQDVSHLLASVFREVFTRDVISDNTVKNLAISKSGDSGYHDKYVEQLRKIQEERDRRHRDSDMLETHIMQAQAAAMAADEKELQKKSEGYENYHSLGLPPANSNLRNFLDTELLRSFNLIVPEDFLEEEVSASKAPQADEIPGYARLTSSSHQRFRKTPPLTDYLDDMDLSTSPWPWASLSAQADEKRREREMYTLSPTSAKSRLTKPSVWKESMKPEHRQIERDDLKRLQNKAEYKRNPRFVPPLKSGLTKSNRDKKKKKLETEKESKPIDPVEIFIASPSPVLFTAYEAGKVYELLLELKNVSSTSRQLRIIPPATKYFSVGLGRFPGEHGVVAPGLSCQYPIKFTPDSLGDFDDVLKVKTQVDPPLIIAIQARRPPPVLSLSPVLDCGHALVGGKKIVQLNCENSGGDGQFCIMKKSSWPSTKVEWTSQDLGCVLAEPFELKPAMFKLAAGETTTIEITFCPLSAKYFQEEVVLICDNCQVKEYTIEGTGQMAGVELEAVSGGLSEPEIGEMRDVSAKYLVRFQPQNPETITEKTLVIKNTTNVALPFRWKLYKPFFRCPVSPGCHVQPSVGSSQVPRTPEDLGVFVITPNMGTIPPHQSVDFILESSPREIGSYHSVGHLILEEIPILDAAGISTGNVKEVTVVEVEMKADSKPFDVCVSPPVIVCPGTLDIGVQYRFPVKVINNSTSKAVLSWRNIEECLRKIAVEPQSSTLGEGEQIDLELVMTVLEPAQIEETILCDLRHSSAPVYVYIKATFVGPEVVFTCPDLNFHLVRFREKDACDHVFLENTSSIPAEWSLKECVECFESEGAPPSEFRFSPDRGVLAPQETQQVQVSFEANDGPRRVRTALQCDVKNGKTSYLSVFCEVQRPLVCLLYCDVLIEKVYLGVPVSREVVLHNQSLLTAHFKWKEVLEGDYTLTFEPIRGYLEPREEMSIKLTFTGHKKGPVSDFVTCCEVERMREPLILSISADVEGLGVTFETPKMFDVERPEEIKETSPDDRQLLLDFGAVPLASCPRTILVLTNTSAIQASFSIEMNYFRAAKPPTPPDGAPKSKRGRILGRTANIADPISKTSTKAHADYCRSILHEGKGAAFVPSLASGELLPFGYQVIELTGYSDMWGEYKDSLHCKIEGLEPVSIPVKMDVVGCPLNLQMMKEQAPILRFGTHVSGAPSVQRSLRINNTSPYDIRLDWASYNVQPQDTQLLDMLVFFGQPLPLFKDGEEVVPVARKDDSFGNEETPFIKVMLKEHDGVRADRPFDVTPRQQIIPAKSHSYAKVSFHPFTKHPSGEKCTGYVAAYMSLEDQVLKVPGYVHRRHGVDLKPFRLDMTARVDPALLSVETEEGRGTEFITAASDLLSGKTPLIHRFVLANTTETPLTMKFETKPPFQVVSAEPPPTAKASKSQTPGTIKIKPTKTVELKVGFCLSNELVRKVNEIPIDQEQEEGTLLTKTEDGDRILIFKRDLTVQFSNNSTQSIPLAASIAVPTLRLSQDVVDFGTCLVGQPVEMHVMLYNPSQSGSAWIAKKDPRYPPVSQQVFVVSPSEGFLEAYASLVSRTKATIKVTFTAKHNIEYECVVIVSGQLQEEEQRLVLRGRGSYDQSYERLVNVTTET
ncbi:deleted in lung and esophageal cancer protein 1-like isoform X1 [Acropora palmata]|uniref:deleted in lung and esophageal cancer protein 1-like isoform X1 n=1 Tax=Acropora palmata TaxID=6131 RepID=UPI003DA138A0